MTCYIRIGYNKTYYDIILIIQGLSLQYGREVMIFEELLLLLIRLVVL